MRELFFIPSTKVNAKVAELVLEGQHINIGGYQYERLSGKPRGRNILRKLVNEKKGERFIIYS